MNQNHLTMEVFVEIFQKGLLDLKTELKSFMMEGFSDLDKKIDMVEENITAEIQGIRMTKADRGELFSLHERVTRLEKKIA